MADPGSLGRKFLGSPEGGGGVTLKSSRINLGRARGGGGGVAVPGRFPRLPWWFNTSDYIEGVNPGIGNQRENTSSI